MAYNFPNSPTVDEVFASWTWDGEKWKESATAPPPGGDGALDFSEAGNPLVVVLEDF